jgi:hypothetical protein
MDQCPLTEKDTIRDRQRAGGRTGVFDGPGWDRPRAAALLTKLVLMTRICPAGRRDMRAAVPAFGR